MRLNALVDGLATRAGPALLDPEITGATLALADVRPGVLFVARRDWYGDTHGQVPAALAAGAAAALVSRAEALPTGAPGAVAFPEDPTLGLLCARLFGEPTRGLRVYGVTGTKGKTTVAYLLEHLLRAVGERPAMMGTVVYRFEGASVTAANTTPDALVLQQFAADARERGATALVLEVSSHALHIGRVAGVAFDAVGLTNLGRDHLDFHGTPAAYAEAKARLFGPCLEAARAAGKAPAAAICVDATGGLEMRGRVAPGVPVLEVSRSVAAAASTHGGDGTPGAGRLLVGAHGPPRLDGTNAVLTVQTAPGRLERHVVDLPLVGDHNLENAGLAVAMVAATHPDHLATLWAALAGFPGVPGRLERVAPDVFVDYAHTPEAVEGTLAAVRARTERPLTVVLGCGGDRDRGKRPLMARAAVEGADRVILTSDNPRSEAPSAILDEMLTGIAGLGPEADARVLRVEDRAAAIAAALSRDGVVLVAGKGHERTQTVGAHVYHFDDREEVRRLWRAQQASIPPDDAPLSWGLAPGEAVPRAVLRQARRRPGGLVLIEAPDGETATRAGAATSARFGAAAVVSGTLTEVEALLTPRHRVAIVVGPAGEPPDAVFAESLDLGALSRLVAARGPPPEVSPRRVPRLP